MNRLELLGTIIEELSQQDDATLRSIPELCRQETDEESLEFIPYGKDDTEHILASPFDAAYLPKVMKKYAEHAKVTPEHAYEF